MKSTIICDVCALDSAPSPAADDLFTAGDNRKLDTERADEFHTFVAKGLWATKRARPDLNPAIAVLCTRVKQPTSKALHSSKLLTRHFFLLNPDY